MQATRKTHVVVDSSEFAQRLEGALIQAVGGGVKVVVDASLLDDEDQYRFVAGVTLKTEAQVRQAVVTKVQELLSDVDVEERVLDGDEIDLDSRLIALVLGVPVLEWDVFDVSRNLGSFMLDVVVDRSNVPEAELPVAAVRA